MSKKASPTLIGVFVLGAVGLLVGAALLFGAGELFRKSDRVVTYFDGSVRGLRVGANVIFRGVPVGRVVDIRAVVDPETLDFDIPVLYELPEGRVSYLHGERFKEGSRELFEELVAKGMRAQLITESIVTGQLAVQLDFHPNTEAVFRAPTDEYAEIPSIPTGLQEMLRDLESLVDKVEALPLQQLVEEAIHLVQGVDELVRSAEVHDMLAGLDSLINAEDTQQLSHSARVAVDKLTATLDDTQKLMRHADAEVGPVIESVMATLAQAEGFLKETRRDLGENSELHFHITSTLNEVENAMRSLRIFLDLLERHPEAFIKGKSGP